MSFIWEGGWHEDRLLIDWLIDCDCGHLSALLSLPSKPFLWLWLWEGQELPSLLWVPVLWKGGNLFFTNFLADSNGKAGLGTTRLNHLQAFCLIYILCFHAKGFDPHPPTGGWDLEEKGQWHLHHTLMMAPPLFFFFLLVHVLVSLQQLWSFTGQPGSWGGLVAHWWRTEWAQFGGQVEIRTRCGAGKKALWGPGLWWPIDWGAELCSQPCNVLVNVSMARGGWVSVYSLAKFTYFLLCLLWQST